jgi:hypothetical protein
MCRSLIHNLVIQSVLSAFALFSGLAVLKSSVPAVMGMVIGAIILEEYRCSVELQGKL